MTLRRRLSHELTRPKMVGSRVTLTAADVKVAKALVSHYDRNRNLFEVMISQLSVAIQGAPTLMQHVHSSKFRVKDRDHLLDKLLRKMLDAKQQNKKFTITEKNLFSRINDLAGFRILHLHTQQMGDIDRELRAVLDEYRYTITEGPSARTWDDENREYFNSLGIKTIKSPTMYTSVHYIIKPNKRTEGSCEIQVRTLAEELWGEVDHSMNYPHPSPSHACREQIKVLARITSSCSRLVDSIFETSRSHEL